MLVTAKQILTKARKGRYAVAAFNVNNLEIVQAMVEAAVKQRSPIILQTSEGAVDYAGMDYLYLLMRLAAESPIPVAIHLDHGKDLNIIKEAIEIGYTSVMFDGSSLPYQENIKKTKQVVAWARKNGVSVEAELGAIQGIEDFVNVSARDAALTDPKQAVDFVRQTKCDSLAIAIGTAHGLIKYKGTPKLDFKRLEEIRSKVNVPLVLHGASEVDQEMVRIAKKYGAKLSGARGVTDALIKKAVRLGICKVNTDTDIRLAFDAGVREIIATKPEVFDPRKLMGKAKEYMVKVAMDRMAALGSKGKA